MNLFRHGGLNSFPVDTDLYGGGISHPGIMYFSSLQMNFLKIRHKKLHIEL